MKRWQKLTAGAALSAALLGSGMLSVVLTADAAGVGGYVELKSNGKLVLSGDVTKEQIWEYRDNENVKYIFADPGCTFPEDCGKLFMGNEILNEDIEPSYTEIEWAHHWQNVTLIDIRNADTSLVKNMTGMFSDLPKLTTLKISGIDTSNVTNMYGLFAGLTQIETLDVSSFDTSKVTDMTGMFAGCQKLTELDVSGFDTSNVTIMMNMFGDCSGLIALDLSNFNTSKVTSMARMFQNENNLVYLDLSSFDTSNVTDMSWMFICCPKLDTVDVSSFNTSKVKNMEWMFSGYFKSLDLSNFDTSNVTNMYGMFYRCINLTVLNLSSFDTTKVTTMNGMFEGCGALKKITVSDSWSTARVGDSKYMFDGCSSLIGGNGTVFDGAHTDKEYARIDKTGQPGYLTPWGFVITAQPEDAAAAAGKTVGFSVKVTGSGLKYQWQFNSGSGWKDSNAPGAKTPNISLTAYNSFHGYRYRCIISNQKGNVLVSRDASLSINGRVSILQQPEKVSVYSGNYAVFSVRALGTDQIYQWQVNTGSGWRNSNGAGSRTDTLSFRASAAQNGYQYRCIVKSASGTGIYSDAVTVTVM